ncbi:MAG: hypothetical protein J1E96_06395 [Ruminococcus sp.]|nr:hypothetical protein [Ruminococcus sp.]
MLKKILCGVIVGATALLCASCSCADGDVIETQPPKTIEISPKIEIGQYAYFVTAYNWINDTSGDTINFESDGTFIGKIDGESYRGVFDLSVDKEKLGYLKSGVTLDGTDEEVTYTIHFITSSEIEVTTDKGKSETYVADWTLE